MKSAGTLSSLLTPGSADRIAECPIPDRRAGRPGQCGSFVSANRHTPGVVFLRNVRNLDLFGIGRGRSHPAALHGARAASPVSRVGISLDAVDFRDRGIRNLCKFMADQTRAIVCRTDDHPTRHPFLLLLAQA
jgi:hypothetical protein